MNLELDGKVAVVTGSSRGLGLASAMALVREGCRVTICEHLDGRFTIAHGPHVVGRYTAAGEVLEKSEKARAPRCGNAAPRKARKTQKASLPLFPPPLEIRHKPPDSHIPTATTADVAIKIVQGKKNQNRTDHLL